MDIEIRLLGPGDAHLLERLAADVFDEPIHPARLAAYLAESTHHLMVAILDGEVVAQAAAVVHRHPDKPEELYVDEVGVTPALRQRGIARRLMEAMFTHARALGCEEAWLGTETDNRAARSLYGSLGSQGVPIVMYDFDL